MAKKILNFKPVLKGLEERPSADSSSPSVVSKSPSKGALMLADMIIKDPSKEEEVTETPKVEKPIVTFFDFAPSESGGNDATILKGFNVPNGYVLQIATETTNKTLQSNEYSGGPYTYQQVVNGEVEGWTLMPVNPAGNASAAPSQWDQIPFDFDEQSAYSQQTDNSQLQFDPYAQYKPWDEVKDEDIHPMFDMTAQLKQEPAGNDDFSNMWLGIDTGDIFTNTGKWEGFNKDAMNAVAFENLINGILEDPDDVIYGHIYGDPDMMGAALVQAIEDIEAGATNHQSDGPAYEALRYLTDYFEIMGKGMESREDIYEMIKNDPLTALNAFTDGVDHLIFLSDTLSSVGDKHKIDYIIHKYKDIDIPEFMAQDGNFAALMLVDAKKLKHDFYAEAGALHMVRNAPATYFKHVLRTLCPSGQHSLAALIDRARMFYGLDDMMEPDDPDFGMEMIDRIYNRVNAEPHAFLSNVLMDHLQQWEGQSTLMRMSDLTMTPELEAVLRNEMKYSGMAGAEISRIWEAMPKWEDFENAFPDTLKANLRERAKQQDRSAGDVSGGEPMAILRREILDKLPPGIAENLDIDIQYGAIGRSLGGTKTPEALMNLLPDKIKEMLVTKQLHYNAPMIQVDDLINGDKGVLADLPVYTIEGMTPAESKIYHLTHYLSSDALEFLMSQGTNYRVDENASSQTISDYINQCIEETLHETLGKEALKQAHDMVWGWTSGPGGSMSRVAMAMKMAMLHETGETTRSIKDEWGLEKRRAVWQDYKGTSHPADYDEISKMAKDLRPALIKIRDLSRVFFHATHGDKMFTASGKPYREVHRGAFIEPTHPYFKDYADGEDFVKHAHPELATLSSFSYERSVANNFAFSSGSAPYSMTMTAQMTEDNVGIDCRLFNTKPFIIKLNDGNIVAVSRPTYNTYADTEAEMVMFSPFVAPFKAHSVDETSQHFPYQPHGQNRSHVALIVNPNIDNMGSNTYG